MRCLGDSSGKLAECKAACHTGKCRGFHDAIELAKATGFNRPEDFKAKPPIYPVEVIEVACRALEAVTKLCDGVLAEDIPPTVAQISANALRIIRDGLASHEKAIKGES